MKFVTEGAVSRRAAGVRQLGGPVELLRLPPPRAVRADEVLIDVQACGAGNWDEFVRTGGWDTGIHPPMALGVEAAGARSRSPWACAIPSSTRDRRRSLPGTAATGQRPCSFREGVAHDDGTHPGRSEKPLKSRRNAAGQAR